MIHVDFYDTIFELGNDRQWKLVGSEEDFEMPNFLIHLNAFFGSDWVVDGYAPDWLMAQAEAAIKDVGIGSIVMMSPEHLLPSDAPEGAVF